MMLFAPVRSLITLAVAVVICLPAYNQYHDQVGLPPASDLPGWIVGQVEARQNPAIDAKVDVVRAKAQLARLDVRPAGSMSNYSREAFRHWSDPDGNGCDAREDALRRDGRKLVRHGCTIDRGTWRDPYGGSIAHDPSSLDIDHVVPLANAWRSGAARWSASEREKIANDPRNLLAVNASLNRQKGDKGPEAWKPPLRGYRAAYAARWIAIKSAYSLSVTPAEKRALADMLS